MDETTLEESRVYESFSENDKFWWHSNIKWKLSGVTIDRKGPKPYMWSLPIWHKPPDMAPPFTPSRRGRKNPDIYEFRFFAFAKS